jgi:VanZ family protein
MRTVRLVICLAYWALLTLLLLTPNPAAVVGLKEIPSFPWVHFAAFALLAVLTCAVRWPQPPGWYLVVLLLGYGIATESLQALVPHRTVAMKDYLGNILGILVATALYRLVHATMQPRRGAPTGG